jgi:hypothetical protein
MTVAMSTEVGRVEKIVGSHIAPYLIYLVANKHFNKILLCGVTVQLIEPHLQSLKTLP